jgi:hypothetical protein
MKTAERGKGKVGYYLPLVMLGIWSMPVLALETSVGALGIDARQAQQGGQQLTGRRIFIGQLELSRPRRPGLDRPVPGVLMQPFRVFFRDRPAEPNRHLHNHAHQVAAVMINRDPKHRGVAPGAQLLSSAYSERRQDGQPEAAIAAQHLVQQAKGDLRGLNLSFGEPLSDDARPKALLDGNALLTLCLDWLAYQFNTLPVVAGNQGTGGIPIPSDLYNGIVVGFTRQHPEDRLFRLLDNSNLVDEPFEDRNGNRRYDRGERFTDINRDKVWTPRVESPSDGRRGMHLLAPGNNILLPNLFGRLRRASGTSYASPHVVGAIALLQEYAERQIQQGQWTEVARRHELTKAVLLNAADKLEDRGDGLLLGMTRTVVDDMGRTWRDTDAYARRDIPLSDHFGAGHLNVARALQQMQAGQFAPGAVPSMGWDTQLAAAGSTTDYMITTPIPRDGHISATLTWSRAVTLQDSNQNQQFDLGEDFLGQPLPDFNLHLLREEDNDIRQSVWSSVSSVDNVEHIFIPVPARGRYKLRVVAPGGLVEPHRYAIAWWAAR